MEYRKNKNRIALKISKGEQVRKSLEKLLELEDIKFASITSIGAIENTTLGYMKPDATYVKKTFEEPHELLSLIGSIAGDNEIHMHASLSGEDYKVVGGHFFEATVAGVVEMFIDIHSDEKVNKSQKDGELLKTWDLENKI